MALIHCDFYSDVLGLSVSMDAIIPQETRSQIGMKGAGGAGPHPTLYLLHGMSDDHTIWQRRTSIERYVAPMGLAVMMPAVHRSFYCDMVRGYKYWTFVSEELPELCRGFFRLSEAREENFVAGLSMGGYGAMKLGLRCPEKFAAAASLSGAVDRFRNVDGMDEARRLEWENVFGDLTKVAGGDNDLFHLAEELASSGAPRPKLYQCCGTEDFLYEGNLRFRDHVRELGYDLTYEEGPGEHEWGFWDKMIQNVLAWLPLEREGTEGG